MDRLQQLFNMPGRGQGGGAPDAPVVDTAEKLHISSLALLKMLKHGEASRDGETACRLGRRRTGELWCGVAATAATIYIVW